MKILKIKTKNAMNMKRQGLTNLASLGNEESKKNNKRKRETKTVLFSLRTVMVNAERFQQIRFVRPRRKGKAVL